MRFLLTLAIITVLPFATLAQTLQDRITEYTLPNGMDIVVIEDHRAPIATHMVYYRIGSADDPRGKSGIAHFLEHLMFKGTQNLESGEFSQIVSVNGGKENAFTNWDYTAYHQRVASFLLPLMMELEAERMQGLLITEDEVLTERDVVLEERNHRTDSKPDSLFAEHHGALLSPNHPYGIPIIGWRHEIETLNRQDAWDFYKAHYAPNNAILIVAGDVNPVEVLGMAQTYYGGLQPSDAVAPRVRATEPPARAPIRTVFADERTTQPYITRRYRVPSRQSGDQRAAAAMQMFAFLLGGTGLTSVMGQELELEQKVSVEQSARYYGVAYDHGTFSLYATPAPGVALSDLEAAMDKTVADFLARGVAAEHLARIKTQIKAQQIYALDNQERLAQNIGGGLTSGLTLADILEWSDLLQTITAEEIIAAGRTLDINASVTGWMVQESASIDADKNETNQ